MFFVDWLSGGWPELLWFGGPRWCSGSCKSSNLLQSLQRHISHCHLNCQTYSRWQSMWHRGLQSLWGNCITVGFLVLAVTLHWLCVVAFFFFGFKTNLFFFSWLPKWNLNYKKQLQETLAFYFQQKYVISSLYRKSLCVKKRHGGNRWRRKRHSDCQMCICSVRQQWKSFLLWNSYKPWFRSFLLCDNN